MNRSHVNPLPRLLFEDRVRDALREDLGRAGDLTTDAIVPPGQRAAARIAARREGVVSGLAVARCAVELLDSRLRWEVHAGDGSSVEAGATLVRMEARARAVLTGERTALNFLGRLSGIATLTAQYVEAVRGTGAAVVCTRKTTPGLRALEKYAVRCGGGFNHRFGLDDAVLIKDNHLVAAGSVREAVERVRRHVGHLVKVELEVDTLQQLDEGLAVGVDAVLLDNMAPATLAEAVGMVNGRAITEASGGINLETAAAVAASGVDLLSVGALTHSAPVLDLGLDFE
jgi:nicotinate-nucleotide pyrophosphorylase (carboxylating)